MRFRASEERANAALAGLVWQPDLDWFGADWLNVTVDDLGYSGGGGPKNDTARVPLFVHPVADPPVLSVPGPVAVSVWEDHAVHVPCGALARHVGL